jgi:Pyruvate/2-oxoacid:ferredoxin oxidoreductase gamma subunit
MVCSKVYRPDGLVVLDRGLLAPEIDSIVGGLKPGGWILINSPLPASAFPELRDFNVCTIDAAAISRRHRLGSATAPIVNTVMAGALAAFQQIATMDNLAHAVRHAVPV